MRVQEDIFESIDEARAHHVLVWSDKATGLRAICVIDDVSCGPAAGGVRTQPYPSFLDALRDAASLARAMTRKCALAGLAAGGGKIVVMEHSGLDRAAAFDVLGRRLRDLGGLFWAGSDLGTRHSDLEAMARHSRFVHTDDRGACLGVAQSVRGSIEACARMKGHASLRGLSVAVQGCGAVGAAVAETLAAAGARVIVADVDRERAQSVASSIGAETLAPEEILFADVDVVSPCAVGGVITSVRAEQIRAWAIAGGANNVLSSRAVGELLQARGILYVPDIISSAGGVAAGVAHDVMGHDDPSPFVERLAALAFEVLEEAGRRQTSTVVVAEERAARAVEEARAAKGLS